MTVVAVESEVQGRQATFTYATAGTTLMYGDLILVVGRIKDAERFAEAD